MLELAVLGLLQEQPLHGYELKKRLGETLGFLWGVSYGSLYPALKRLERDGAIAVVEGEATSLQAPPPPPTGSLSGDLAAARLRRHPRTSRRTRKAYRITDTGRALFARLLADDDSPADDERSFALRLSFCRFLPAERRLELLERRRAQLADRLVKSRRPDRPGRASDRYTRSLIEHRARTTEHDINWIDELITAERRDLAERPEGATA